MTFDDDHIAALQAFGYTEREARFVYVVAAHSGYFLTEHFRLFTGTRHGKVVDQLLTKLADLGHARDELHHARGTKRYHLFARTLYRAIGREDSRNRRKHAVRRINVKLHTLRFVLEHADFDYLEEETDKLDYFVDELGVDRSVLPARTYQSNRGERKRPATRYFVDRFPLMLTPERTPVFTFVDERETSTDAFRTHLVGHLALLRALPVPSKMLFVSPTRGKFRDARHVFERVMALPSDVGVDSELSDYFELRRLWETGELAGFTKEMFGERIEGEKKFASAHHEELYRSWLSERLGTTEDSPCAPSASAAPTCTPTSDVTFDTHWLSSGA